MTGARVVSIATAASRSASCTGLVGADLVARRPVRLEGEDHRRRAPVAVVAVPVALPFADAALELALEVVRRVGQPEDGERHLDPGRRAPGLLELVREDGLGVGDDVDVDRDPRRGRRWASASARASASAQPRVDVGAVVGVGVGVGSGVGGGGRDEDRPVASAGPGRARR